MSIRGIGAITNIGSNILLSTKKNNFFWGKKYFQIECVL